MADTFTNTLYLFNLPSLPDDENYALDVAKYYEDELRPVTLYLEEVATSYIAIQNFQLQRIQLNNIFTVALGADYAQSIYQSGYKYNYATLYYYNDNVKVELPYRIEKILWNGTESCKIIATLDVATFYLNEEEYKPDIIKDGVIERAHIDRFEGVGEISGTNYLIPKVDYHEEPFGEAPKYLNTSYTVNSFLDAGDIDKVDWNLVYYSDPNATNAIRTFIVPDTEQNNFSARVENNTYLSIEGDTYYIIRKIENSAVTFDYDNNYITFDNSYPYEEIHVFNDGGTITVTKYGWNTTNVGNNWKALNNAVTMVQYTSLSATKIYVDSDVIYYTNPSLLKNATAVSNYVYAIPVVPQTKHTLYLNTTSTTVNLTGLDDIPLTNPRLIKIISCPFCPVSALTDVNCIWRNISDDYMSIYAVEYLGNEFDKETKYTATHRDMQLIEAPQSFDNINHSKNYETKLLNSNYSEYSFEYGGYKYIAQPENFEYDIYAPALSLDISYKQSMLKSDLFFYFYPANDPNPNLPSYERNLVSSYLISDIDNEKPIFTSEYLNYIKNGYNFDKANMNRQTVVSSLLAGTSILGGVAGVAAGGVTGGVSAAAGIGLITSGVSSAINIINNRIASEASIQRKLVSYKNSSTGVAGVNALDLRKEYSGYKLQSSEYLMSDELENDIYNFFRLYGYQLNNYVEGPKSYLYSRRYYNYIKFKTVRFYPEFLSQNAKHSELVEEFRRILTEGLTIYHIPAADEECDFEKVNENFEVSLT